MPRHYTTDGGAAAVGGLVVSSNSLREAMHEVTAAIDRGLTEDERRHRELLAQLAVLAAAIHHARTERHERSPEEFAEHLLRRLEALERRPSPSDIYGGAGLRNGNGEAHR